MRGDFIKALLATTGESNVPDGPLVVAEKAKTAEEQADHAKAFLAAIDAREKRLKVVNDAAAKAANADYSKGFSGSAADTKAEKDFAKLALGGADEAADDGVPEAERVLLAPIGDVTAHDMEELRKVRRDI